VVVGVYTGRFKVDFVGRWKLVYLGFREVMEKLRLGLGCL
jgi:hypothetical protein